jgi:hypothetical protein
LVNFWPLAASAVGFAVLADRLLALRPSSIRVDSESLVVRSRIGFTDRRDLSSLMTIEWHEQGWRSAIVLNFVDYTDNLRVSGTGYSRSDVVDFANLLQKRFVDVVGGASQDSA